MGNADFFQRLTEMLNNVVEASANNALLRYVSADSLKYLVDPSADIACSNFLYHDESKEIVAGARRFLDWLVDNISLSAAHRDALDSKIVALVQERASSCPFAPYVFCLTERKDEPADWCHRAGDGGFAVAFDKKALRERIGAINASPLGGRLMFLMPVLCLKSNSQHIPLFFDLLYRQGRDAFDRYVKDDPSAGCDEVLAQILVAAAIVKDEEYSVRREWRLVLLPASGDVREAKDSLASAIKEKQKNPKPRLKSGMLRSPVKGDLREIVRCIYVSPQGDRDRLRSQLVNRLRALPSPLTGDEVVGDGLLFVRNSAHSAENLCNQCAIRHICVDRKPDAVGGRGGCNPVGNKGKGWNRPNAANQPVKRGGAKAPSMWKGVVAGLLVVAIAVGVSLYLLSDRDAKPKATVEKGTGLIKEVTPAPAPAAKPERTKPEKTVPEKRVVTNGLYAVGDVVRNAYGREIKIARVSRPGTRRGRKAPRQLFTNQAERDIDNVLSAKPGFDRMLDTFDAEGFKKSFVEAIMNKIEITPEDTEEEAERKRAVIAAKEELKTALKNGEDIVQMMKDTRAEIVKAADMRDNLLGGLAELRKSGASEDEVNDYIAAANKMFEKHGIKPILSQEQIRERIEAYKIRKQNESRR